MSEQEKENETGTHKGSGSRKSAAAKGALD